MDLLGFFCLVFVMSLCASVYLCLVVTCWERADSWLSFVVSNCYFPIGILCQVWYLIVSIPDLCTLAYFSSLDTITLLPLEVENVLNSLVTGKASGPNGLSNRMLK